MDFQKFKNFLTEKMFLFCNWDEDEWHNQYVYYKETISSYNPEYIAKQTEDALLFDYAKDFYSLMRRDTHDASLKEEYLPSSNYSVFYCVWDQDISLVEPSHELVKAPDPVTAIEKVILSGYVNHNVKALRKKWFSNLNSSCFEDIQSELEREGIYVSQFNIDSFLK